MKTSLISKLRDGLGRFACTNSGVIANIYFMCYCLRDGTRDETS